MDFRLDCCLNWEPLQLIRTSFFVCFKSKKRKLIFYSNCRKKKKIWFAKFLRLKNDVLNWGIWWQAETVIYDTWQSTLRRTTAVIFGWSLAECCTWHSSVMWNIPDHHRWQTYRQQEEQDAECSFGSCASLSQDICAGRFLRRRRHCDSSKLQGVTVTTYISLWAPL